VTRPGRPKDDRQFIYDRGRLIEEYDLLGSADAPVARYFYADSDEPVAVEFVQSGGQTNRYYYLRGHDGSVLAVADADGVVVERIRYDPWGQPTLERRDTLPPRVIEIRTAVGALIVQFSEPVLPPLDGVGPGPDLVATTAPLDSGFTVEGVAGVTPVYEESRAGYAFGSVVRLNLIGAPGNEITVRVLAGILEDAWGNANPGETIPFDYPHAPNQVVYAAPTNTAPVQVARSVVGSPFLFHGQYFDYDAGLVYLRMRFYDPSSGLFLERDPEGYTDSVNLYAAFAHNPVSFRDPAGRSVGSVFGKAIGELAEEALERAGKRAASEAGEKAVSQGARGAARQVRPRPSPPRTGPHGPPEEQTTRFLDVTSMQRMKLDDTFRLFSKGEAAKIARRMAKEDPQFAKAIRTVRQMTRENLEDVISTLRKEHNLTITPIFGAAGTPLGRLSRQNPASILNKDAPAGQMTIALASELLEAARKGKRWHVDVHSAWGPADRGVDALSKLRGELGHELVARQLIQRYGREVFEKMNVLTGDTMLHRKGVLDIGVMPLNKHIDKLYGIRFF